MKNFDENIRDRIFDAEMPVSGNVWDAIESQIKPAERKPNLWFMFLIAAFVLPGLMFYADTLNDKDATQEAPVQLVAEKSMAVGDSPLPFSSKEPITEDQVAQEIKEETTSSSANTSVVVAESIEYKTEELQPINDNYQPIIKRRFETVNTKQEEFNTVLLKFGQVKHLPKLSSSNIDLVMHGLNTNQNGLEKIKSLFNPKPKCPSFNKRLPKIYAWADGASSMPFQNLSAVETELNDLVDLRNSEETGMVSFSAALGLGFEFSNGLYLESGLSFDKINTVFEHAVGNESRKVTYIEIDTIWGAGGDIEDFTIEMDTSYYFETGTITKIHVNNFKQIDIPLKVGYTYRVLPKLHVKVDGGLLVNVASWNEGHILNENKAIVSYGENGSIDLFKKKLGLAYMANLGVTTPLNSRFSLDAGLDLRWYPDRSLSQINRIKQSYTKIGLSAGINYRL